MFGQSESKLHSTQAPVPSLTQTESTPHMEQSLELEQPTQTVLEQTGSVALQLVAASMHSTQVLVAGSQTGSEGLRQSVAAFTHSTQTPAGPQTTLVP
jgi:hypothetical protein